MKMNPLASLKQLWLWIILVLTLSFSPDNAKATHLVGGEITYEWLSGNQYKLRLTLYRDCAGINAPINVTIPYISASCNQSGFTVLTLTGFPSIVTPLCPTALSQSTCNGGTLYSVKQYIYEGTVTLPASCNDWVFSYSECCRNGGITNLASPGSSGMYVSAMLNNLDFPFNNSVGFVNVPVNVIYSNSTTNLNWNSYDVDGDSIIYELVAAQNSNGVSVNYAGGYSFLQPFNNFQPTTLNGSGILTVSPATQQVCVVSMRVSEFRQGVLVGRVHRDFQVAVIMGTNAPPELTGINGTTSFIASGCPGDTIMFDVFSSDPDPGQITSLIMSANPTAATFTVTGSPYATGKFFWIPQPGDISSQPYIFTVRVSDDNCPYFGTQTYAYHIYVNGCNTNDVWPGDANSDGTADLYDLLAIGLAYGDNGPVRPSASLAWVNQPCPDWTNSFLSGINYKHADTDGNGMVDADDTTAIMLNYGLSHPLRNGAPASANVADLIVTASADTVGLSTLVTFDIDLATTDSIYGLAFRMYFDPALVDFATANVTYPNSMFGTNGVDMVKIDRAAGNSGVVEIALSRINQQNLTNGGSVARITIVTTDNVSGKVMLAVTPYDVEAITADGNGVTINALGDGILIDPAFTSVNELLFDRLLSVYPVPAKNMVHVDLAGNHNLNTITLKDITGRIVQTAKPSDNKMTLDLVNIPRGSYTLSAEIDGVSVHRKIILL
jgi:hypothetical protein